MSLFLYIVLGQLCAFWCLVMSKHVAFDAHSAVSSQNERLEPSPSAVALHVFGLCVAFMTLWPIMTPLAYMGALNGSPDREDS